MREILPFGSANVGLTVTFSIFKNADTLANIAAPTVVEIGGGEYYFDWDWTLTTATSIIYVCSVPTGTELEGLITTDAVTAGTGTATGGAANLPWLWTAGQIINTAATECGLAEVVDPYSSVDVHFIRFRTLLKAVGLELSKARDWALLVKEGTVTGDGSTTLFNVPADYLRMKSDSGWNRTTRFPMALLASQGWQALRAQAAVLSPAVLYREVQGRLEFYSAPALNDSVKFDYVSRYWVISSGASTADLYVPANSSDKVLFEPDLAVKALKVKFLVATNQDASGAIEEYATAYESAAGVEASPVLSMVGRRSNIRLLDIANVPDTGIGQ